ncbi:SGNH/GDSL hydrolase family protein [Crossiella sp. SN42]|uniref:SGNH/GDSL hydrolase family protein n=1 Tax=Crossiella sp. SN42 TaxID=2944808 RepID=UPI00207C12AA|nr:SGNH/GDSL hydrolase family protein [Crossiella sp. SN42]MCO1577366.1 SGNH/GDSL hydrolase family protein [Crossiella sp. SN42]
MYPFAARPRRGRPAALVLAVLALVLATSSGAAATRPDRAGAHWVHTWTAMPQQAATADLPPPPFTQDGVVLANATLRQTVHASLGGTRIRLRFSNAFGTAPLPIAAVSVALPQGGAAGVSAVQPGSVRPVTFQGKASTIVQRGAQTVSDPLDFPVAAQANLTVTAYLAQGLPSNSVTAHPGSRTTSHLAQGNEVMATDLTRPTATDRWYLLSGIEVWSGASAAAVAVVGDSLTDGRGSTHNLNNRWPDRLLARLQANPATAAVAVLNQAAGGNRVLNHGIGPSALSRLDRDVLAHSGVAWLVLFEGINDIGGSALTEQAQQQMSEELIAAYDQIIIQSHAQGIRVYGATLLPFGGSSYDDPGNLREATRQRVNDWVRTSNRFDAVIDLDRAVRDPRDPSTLLPAYDTGDHLHLNPAGYQALANAVPERLFTGVNGSPR